MAQYRLILHFNVNIYKFTDTICMSNLIIRDLSFMICFIKTTMLYQIVTCHFSEFIRSK